MPRRGSCLQSNGKFRDQPPGKKAVRGHDRLHIQIQNDSPQNDIQAREIQDRDRTVQIHMELEGQRHKTQRDMGHNRPCTHL